MPTAPFTIYDYEVLVLRTIYRYSSRKQVISQRKRDLLACMLDLFVRWRIHYSKDSSRPLGQRYS